MGKKVHPFIIRTDIYGWRDVLWFDRKSFKGKIAEDCKIREFVHKSLDRSLFSHLSIGRVGNKIFLNLHTHRPGLVIGKKGEAIEKLRSGINKILGKNVDLNVIEVHKPDIDPKMIAVSIAQQMENRADYRKVIRKAMKSAMRSGAEGVSIIVSGRLRGAEIASVEKYHMGKVPLQSFEYRIFLHSEPAQTIYGTCGVKVFISLGRKSVALNSSYATDNE